MKQETKTALLRELIDLDQNKSPFVEGEWNKESITRYTSAEIFQLEMERLFKPLPHLVAHVSELEENHGFLTRDVAGASILLTRAPEGGIKAFHNVCRHRGARLVGDSSGCKKRFSCPYHAWTYDSGGRLVGVPHEASGFPGLQRDDMGLVEVACEHSDGWIWVCLDPESEWSLASHLGELQDDLEALNAADYAAFDTTTLNIAANWKILIEGGLEAYHFKVAHRNSIAPLFLDNLSSYQQFGLHFRSVLPRATLSELNQQPEEQWDIRKHSNLLYTFMPSSQFLVQEDHLVWIQSKPIAADQTELRLTTMVPSAELTEEKQNYWRANHDFTMRTLQEDFDMGEGIQSGLSSGANTHLNFGRYEGALAALNRTVDDLLDA